MDVSVWVMVLPCWVINKMLCIGNGWSVAAEQTTPLSATTGMAGWQFALLALCTSSPGAAVDSGGEPIRHIDSQNVRQRTDARL